MGLIASKLAEAKLLHQQLVTEGAKVIPQEPEAFRRRLKEFLVEAYAITKLITDSGHDISNWGNDEDKSLMKLMADRRNDFVYGQSGRLSAAAVLQKRLVF